MTHRPPDEPRTPDDKEDGEEPAPTSGDFNVVVGPPPRGSIGSGNVYIRDADAHGNVIHNSPESEAYGFGARAGPSGKAFGAFANAGAQPELLPLLQQLVAALQKAGDGEGTTAVTQLMTEVQSSEPDAGIIKRTWDTVKAAATVNDATAVVLRVEPLIHSLLQAL